MSNASNLSTLANVLDDGTSGQFLKSTGSGGVAFDTVAAGAVVYATADLLPLSGNSAGDMGYVTATNRFYINNGSGWYSVSLVNTNPNITSVQDASSGTTPFTLATDQTATVITVTAADPEEVPLTYGYSVTSGSLNGSTVAQGTGNNTNVFTVTPHASQDATFTITFTASDGINQATSANAFSLSFVTVVTDSNHTTLLATATGTSDNNNITDSSSNSHSITVNGDSYAGTFSPYRSGGYSTSFSRSDSSKLEIASMPAIGSGDCSIEFWCKIDSQAWNGIISRGAYNSSGTFSLSSRSGDTELTLIWSGTIYTTSGANIEVGKWKWVQVIRSSGTVTIYVNGSSVGSWSNSANVSSTSNYIIGRADSSDYFGGDLRDLRISTNAQSSSNGSEKLATDSNTTFLSCHLPYLSYATSSVAINTYSSISGTIKTVSNSPYDYTEYDAADHGGSIVINSTSAWVQSTVTAPSTGSLAVECWVYWDEFPSTSNGNNQSIISFKGSDNYDGVRLMYKSPSSEGFAVYANDSWFMSQSASPLKAKVWYHAAITYDGTNLRLFVNGSLIDTKAFSTDLTNADLRIGNDGWWRMGLGKVSDVRYTRGSAVYTTGFTPPTAPLSSTNAEFHLKGTDASIIDKSQGGNAKLTSGTTGSSTQVKFSGSKSIYFSGVDGEGLSLPYNTLQIAAGEPWTIEFWFWIADGGGTRNGIFIQQGDGSVTYPPIRIDLRVDATQGISPSCQLSNSSGAYGNSITSYEWQSYENWHHVAFVSNGTTVTRYINGTAYSTMSDNHYTSTSTDDVTIGGRSSSSEYRHVHAGYYEDIRITKGKARYTANFTPPSKLEG